jgi:hypothetical protein
VLTALWCSRRRLVLLARGRTIPELRADFETAVGQDGFGSPQLIGANSMLETRIGEEGPDGKSWFEAQSHQRRAEQLLSGYVAALGVHHLVQGHQHQRIGLRRRRTA